MNYLKKKEWVLKMCDVCLQNPCHSCCPNYEPPKASRYCSVCGEGIYEGEEYITNDDNECRHSDCFYELRDLLEWLGSEIMTMEEYDDRDY